MSPACPCESYSNFLHGPPGGGGSQTPDNGLAGFLARLDHKLDQTG